MTHFVGYAGNILRVDLSTGDVNKVPTAGYEELFLVGRGIAAKIYWDEVPPGIKAFDPENRLVFIKAKLEELNLGEVAKKLEGLGLLA